MLEEQIILNRVLRENCCEGIISAETKKGESPAKIGVNGLSGRRCRGSEVGSSFVCSKIARYLINIYLVLSM